MAEKPRTSVNSFLILRTSVTAKLKIVMNFIHLLADLDSIGEKGSENVLVLFLLFHDCGTTELKFMNTPK